MRHIDDDERRARLAVRHALHPAHRVADPLAATRAMTVLHATEPATPFLSVAARVEGSGPAAVEAAFYEDRCVVKQLAMRRTLFAFPRELLPVALGSASARVAGQQRRLVAQDVQAHGVAEDGAAWLEAARQAVLERLADGSALSARQLREELPELAGTTVADPSKRYGAAIQFGPRVLTVLHAEGLVTRGPNAGHWRTSRPTWTLTDRWLGEPLVGLPPREGYAVLVRHWLRTFGPGTEVDLAWWLGATKAAVRAALADVGAVQVSLDRGGAGWVLPEDVEPEDLTGTLEPWAALLPVLDPTTMGWRGREFYLDPAHVPVLFDRNGNAGTTAWWNGRVVGAWQQEPDGRVLVVYCDGQREAVGEHGRAALAIEADRLSAWLDGVLISNVYPSPLMKCEP